MNAEAFEQRGGHFGHSVLRQCRHVILDDCEDLFHLPSRLRMRRRPLLYETFDQMLEVVGELLDHRQVANSRTALEAMRHAKCIIQRFGRECGPGREDLADACEVLAVFLLESLQDPLLDIVGHGSDSLD